jgi:hypothetical protein
VKSEQLPFVKLVSALFDSGLWARMSAGARALYPALLRFSDGQFKPVYPGTKRLMDMTGFKHKKSIRDARQELVRLGLISIATGSGRENTYYNFRFDWARGDTGMPHSGRLADPSPGDGTLPQRAPEMTPGGPEQPPPYNQIQITIHNHPEKGDEMRKLQSRFGEDRVRSALTELNLAGMEASPANVERILSRGWLPLRSSLAGMISPESLRLLDAALLEDTGSALIFQASLPEHLKKILTRHGGDIEFVHSTDQTAVR